MGKRSQKRLSRHERDQAGCINGLISIFDFRHTRTTKKLLLERRQVGKQDVGSEHISTKTILPDSTASLQNIADDEENKMPLIDSSKTSVKELMEEELSNEQGPTNQSREIEIDSEQTDTKHGQHVKKRKNRICNKSSDIDVAELNTLKQLIRDRFLEDNLDLCTIIEELAYINQRSTNQKHHRDNDSVIEENIVAAVKLLIENSKKFGEEGKSSCSEDLMDALETLSSNRGLFLKLLQSLEDFQLKEKITPSSLLGPVLLDEKPAALKSEKHKNFFRRRSKSLESLPVEREMDSHSSNRIVILKPGPDGAHSPDGNVTARRISFQSDRNASQFSFTEIKRKLRHAMGKDRNGISPDKLILASPKHQSGSNGEKGDILGWRSPNRNHFYTERFTKSLTSFKKGEQVGRSKDNSRPGVSNIYIEAKKHLSEILNGEESSESANDKLSKPLGRIISFPDYNSSPCFSPRENVAIVNTPPINDEGCSLTEISFISEVQNSVSEAVEIEETTESKPREEEKSFNEVSESKPQEEKTVSSSESCSNSIGVDIFNGVIKKVDNEDASQCFEDYPQCIELDSFEEEQVLSPRTISPSSSPVSKEVEDSECAINNIERPSPISVLDPFFTEECISPGSTISRPVEKEIQPRHIHFEEHSSTNCIRISLQDEESPFEYVEAVLLGSGLNWDEFLSRWLSFQEILDSSLFEEVELFSSKSRHDQKFLFDCANEALKGLCEIHFGGISQDKKIRPVPDGLDLIQKIWKRVEWHVLQLPHPHSLDLLVKKDMMEYCKWMNLRTDIEVIGSEMGEIILDELVEDIVLSFIHDTSECDFQVLLA